MKMESTERDEAGSRQMSEIVDPWVVLYKPGWLWWRPQMCGYTSDILAAGVYTEEDAKRCATKRSPRSDGTYEDEAMPMSVALRRLFDSYRDSAGTVWRALNFQEKVLGWTVERTFSHFVLRPPDGPERVVRIGRYLGDLQLHMRCGDTMRVMFMREIDLSLCDDAMMREAIHESERWMEQWNREVNQRATSIDASGATP